MSKATIFPEEFFGEVETAVPTPTEIIYPESDGEPMAETDTHRDQMAAMLIYPLKEFFRDQPDVYISGNLLIYYQQGNPRRSVAPDVFVVKGVENHNRRTYLLWEEEKAPDLVIEVTSTGTRQRDIDEKRVLYERLGVSEYFLFDPLAEYLDPPLQGFRLTGPYYAYLPPTQLSAGLWELTSEVLGLHLRTVNEELRLYDPRQQTYLRTLSEAEAARRAAEAALQEAEAEIARLRAALQAKAPDGEGD